MTYRVVFVPEAQEQLAELFQYVEEAARCRVATPGGLSSGDCVIA